MFMLKVKITFTEDLLGTAPNTAEIYRDFIGAKGPEGVTRDDEIEMYGAEEVTSKGTTIFQRTGDDKPYMFDYQWRGFFKEKISFLKKIEASKCAKLKAFKKEMDGLIFIADRKNVIEPSGPITLLQRPLRASTAQGERVSLACSECIPAGSTTEITILGMLDSYYEPIKECLKYGRLSGTGQWRGSGGMGRFTHEIIEDEYLKGLFEICATAEEAKQAFAEARAKLAKKASEPVSEETVEEEPAPKKRGRKKKETAEA